MKTILLVVTFVLTGCAAQYRWVKRWRNTRGIVTNSFLFGGVLLVSTIVGCATQSNTNELVTPDYLPTLPTSSSSFVTANYDAADKLIQYATRDLDKNSPIIVGTIVDIDNLQSSTRFGRLISEQVGTRLTQLGYSVIELKLRGDIFVKSGQGEMLLSREVNAISRAHNAQAVVVGTYAEGPTETYINLKIIGAEDIAISAYVYSFPVPAVTPVRAWKIEGGP